MVPAPCVVWLSYPRGTETLGRGRGAGEGRTNRRIAGSKCFEGSAVEELWRGVLGAVVGRR